jgi:hypothetical protein
VVNITTIHTKNAGRLSSATSGCSRNGVSVVETEPKGLALILKPYRSLVQMFKACRKLIVNALPKEFALGSDSGEPHLVENRQITIRERLNSMR